jgi:hypothetical protein
MAIFLLVSTVTFVLTCTSASDALETGGQQCVPEVVSRVNLTKNPLCLVVNEKMRLVYVGDEEGLTVIDCQTDDIVGKIPFNFTVDALMMDQETNRLFVGGDTGKTYVMDCMTNQTVGTIPEGFYRQYEGAVNPFTERIYFAERATFMGYYDGVKVYDAKNFSYIAFIRILESINIPTVQDVGVAVNTQTNRVYAMWSANDFIYLIDGDNNTILDEKWPHSFSLLAKVNPLTNRVYIGHVAVDGETLEVVADNSDVDVDGVFAVNPALDLVYSAGVWDFHILNGTTLETLAELELPVDFWVGSVYGDLDAESGKIYLALRYANQTLVIQCPPYPARFEVGDLKISPTEAQPGENVTAEVTVTNLGDLVGECCVELSVNGTSVENRTLVLDGKQSANISFQFCRQEQGPYEVKVNEQTGIITVIPEFPSVLGVLASLVVITVVIACVKKQRKSARARID